MRQLWLPACGADSIEILAKQVSWQSYRPTDSCRARDKHALEMFAALQSWSVLLLCLRFGTIFKDASSKTEQNHQGLHQEEN